MDREITFSTHVESLLITTEDSLVHLHDQLRVLYTFANVLFKCGAALGVCLRGFASSRLWPPKAELIFGGETQRFPEGMVLVIDILENIVYLLKTLRLGDRKSVV